LVAKDSYFKKFSSNKNTIFPYNLEKKLQTPISELAELYVKQIPEKTIPNFIQVTKLDFDYAEIHGGIIKDSSSKGGLRYTVIEPTLNERDLKFVNIIKKLLMTELSVSLNEIKTKKDAEKRLTKKIIQLKEKYLLKIPKKNLSKITYYIIRDLVHLGKIEPLMRDHNLEEISCDGLNLPLYVWHREFESIPTNIIYTNNRELDNFTRKLAYVCGKHVSMSNPIVDASLPDGSRINLTLGHEITKKGSTFTIRRFRADPISIIDLIKFKSMSIDLATYLWYLAEKKSTMLIAGGTASGKTTSLNALAAFIKPGLKIVSIEDTQELNIPHENWIPSVSRQNFTEGQVAEINQFDLLRAALRQRPDIIIVGETRGREAYTLFQAMATGHGGFSSIHADSVDATLTRLTSSPMDIPKTLVVNTLDVITLQLKLTIHGKSVRRIIQVSEISGLDNKTGKILTNDIFKWNPKDDTYQLSRKSIVLEKIKDRYGESDEQINHELTKRKTALEWMVKNNIRDLIAVSKNIQDFYVDSERYYERKKMLV